MTADEPGERPPSWRAGGVHRRPSALRTPYWRVPTKLAAVLTVPLLGFLVVTGVQISDSVRAASGLNVFSQQVKLGVEVTELVHELQRERDRTVGMLAALSARRPQQRDVGGLAPEWTAVDRAVQRLRARALPLLGEDEALAESYARADERLADLVRLREGVGQGWLRTQAVFDLYSGAITDLQALLPAGDPGGDAELGRQVRGFTDLARAKELAAQIRGQLYLLCRSYGAPVEAGWDNRIADLRAQRSAALVRFRADAVPAQVARFDDTVSGQAVRNADRLEQLIAQEGAAAERGVDAQQWWSASTTELQLLRTVEQTLVDDAVAAVGGASRDQWQTTLVRSVTAIGLLLAALMLSVVIGRNMAFTLRSLREQALVVAEVRLPRVIEQLRQSSGAAPPIRVDPIRVGSRDEVAEVAEAFTAVHRSAVRLAAEQAAMRRNVNEIFIKLALRSQSLVERQLQLLDDMEHAEVDPDKLDNLFRLDHLAARLRRNDENLLVLAGGDTARHWSRPRDLDDIVLAAAAEVEHYQRVRHEIADSVHVVGHAVADVINLVAELLDNGLSFSPPDTFVEVHGHARPDGTAELIITDDGIGMTAFALAEANDQLAAPVGIDSSAAERMGLVVVGHLARRHGIGVGLHSTGRGVTVRVTLPAALLAPAPDPDEAPAALPVRTAADDSGVPEGHRLVQVPPQPGPRDEARPDAAQAEQAPVDGADDADDADEAAEAAEASVWWSRDAPAPVAPRAVMTPAPQVTELTPAGLPVRVRSGAPAAVKAASLGAEVDPDAMGDTLTRLAGGIRRAEAEDEAPDGARAEAVSAPPAG
ncbi:hypothetical protein Cs7R123_16230 [Catellatospora sp. TT07R-123]|uniref:sensor histidine kinase n=1 Tax=Catellatospora sp. TT07R-123 TaxID=2733863 RepID=UPI001B1B7DC0|nr:nitrate- and nitrite sensing domain-containing protein [Catellatospora sp. TT07R-123]GHJ44281.1 hypothetical protein Cs7R123_16230 [Catellatospora sp. TT07R-123]